MDGRAWTLCTQWSGKEAYSLAKKAVRILRNFGHNIELDDTQSINLSLEQLEPDGSLLYKIGDGNGRTWESIGFEQSYDGRYRFQQVAGDFGGIRSNGTGMQKKYGDKWRDYYEQITDPDYGVDLDERMVNRAIYEGHRLCLMGHPARIMELENKYQEKMKRLFGLWHKQYVNHVPNDPKVNKALIKDALKSGKWKELPKSLQEEYHTLVGKNNG